MRRTPEKAAAAIGRYLMLFAFLLPVTGIALAACGQDAASPDTLSGNFRLRRMGFVM